MTKDPGAWRLESSGLHMRADATEAGRLVLLADVVRWLMSDAGQALPRGDAVEQLCVALERARRTPELYRAQRDARAVLLHGESALFGFHTEETWAVKEIEKQTLERMRRNPFEFDLREFGGEVPSALPPESIARIRADVAAGERPMVTNVGERAQYLCEPGIKALARYIRASWGRSPRSTTARDPMDYGQAFGVAVRVSDAGALWGWGVAKGADAAVSAPLVTVADLRKRLESRRKGAPWQEDEKACVRTLFQRRGGWKKPSSGGAYTANAKVMTALAEELDLGRNALKRHLVDGPPDAGSAAFQQATNAFTRPR